MFYSTCIYVIIHDFHDIETKLYILRWTRVSISGPGGFLAYVTLTLMLRVVTLQVEMQFLSDPKLPAEPRVLIQLHLGGDEAGDTLGFGKNFRISTQP